MSATVQITENSALRRSAESEILAPEAVEFLRLLDLRFEAQRISLLSERVECQRNERFASSKFKRAAELLTDSSAGEFQEFLTTAAYAEFA